MKPFRIGDIVVDPPIVLAPMEDVTNVSFRIIAKRVGNPGLMFTEFVSAMALLHAPERTVPKMLFTEEERPLAVQIFGAEPELMAKSATKAEQLGADIVDINMGCWAPKVCRQGSGAALLKDPERAVAIVQAVAEAVRVPVTVKLRAGWDYGHLASLELAPRFEAAGAKCLTLHARTARQGFGGKADWSLIGGLKRAVRVPVIGNGDVRTPQDAKRMFEETGCDGVMIGRAAIGNPWLLARVAHFLRHGEILPGPTFDQLCSVALEHLLRQIRELGDEGRAVRSLRGQLPAYFRGFEGAPRLREALSCANSVDEVQRILTALGQKS